MSESKKKSLWSLFLNKKSANKSEKLVWFTLEIY
jgi:hypothetical protein